MRYVLVAAVAGQPPGGAYGRFGIGTVIVGSQADVQAPTDVVWPSLCAVPNSAMAPLDAAAQAAVAAFTPQGQSWPHYGGPF